MLSGLERWAHTNFDKFEFVDCDEFAKMSLRCGPNCDEIDKTSLSSGLQYPPMHIHDGKPQNVIDTMGFMTFPENITRNPSYNVRFLVVCS